MNKFSGSQIKKKRQAMGKDFTQTRLAFEIGKARNRMVSTQQISMWERGAYQPSAENLMALAHVFRCKPEDFFCSDSSTNRRTSKQKKVAA